MRGILLGIGALAVLVITPLFFCVPVQAQSTATVTITVSVRPPEISLDIHAYSVDHLPPTRFATHKKTLSNLYAHKTKKTPLALALIAERIG